MQTTERKPFQGSGTAAQKREIRSRMQKRRNALTAQELAAYTDAITDVLIHSRLYRECQNLCIYQAFRNEVSCEGILRQALSDHKSVFVPVTDTETKTMEFYQITEHTKWQIGAYGIKEPILDKTMQKLEEKALILMPGLVFDHNKHRIGYGGGYYDKYLKTYPFHTTLALCYSFQIVERELPFEEHDISPDYLVTEQGIL